MLNFKYSIYSGYTDMNANEFESSKPGLRSLNETVRNCALSCGCSVGGFPGWFGKNYSVTRLLFVSQNPGYARSPFKDARKIIWEYSPAELPYDSFQQLYFDEWSANRTTGRWFSTLLSKLNLTYDDVAFTNLVKCPFIDNNFDPSAIDKCKHFLLDQLRILRPQLVVALGTVPASAFIQKPILYTQHNLSLFNLPRFKLVVSPHPSRASITDSIKVSSLIKAAQS